MNRAMPLEGLVIIVENVKKILKDTYDKNIRMEGESDREKRYNLF